LENVSGFPLAAITISDGIVSISGTPSSAGVLLIELYVPSGVVVSVDVAAAPSFELQANDNLLVHNGTLVRTGVNARQGLIPYLSSPRAVLGPPTQQPSAVSAQRMSSESVVSDIPVRSAELAHLPTGDYVAFRPSLMSHLESFNMPNMTGVDVKGQSLNVSFQVDETGTVGSIVVTKGNEAFRSACERAVLSWKFRPFIAGNAAVSVKAMISFHVDPLGHLDSPLSFK
jgi:hypothetical protein